jgi:hypothetical protein
MCDAPPIPPQSCYWRQESSGSRLGSELPPNGTSNSSVPSPGGPTAPFFRSRDQRPWEKDGHPHYCREIPFRFPVRGSKGPWGCAKILLQSFSGPSGLDSLAPSEDQRVYRPRSAARLRVDILARTLLVRRVCNSSLYNSGTVPETPSAGRVHSGFRRTATRSGAGHHATKTRFISVATLSSPLSDARRRVISATRP